jgi:hypothetical protein
MAQASARALNPVFFITIPFFIIVAKIHIFRQSAKKISPIHKKIVFLQSKNKWYAGCQPAKLKLKELCQNSK